MASTTEPKVAEPEQSTPSEQQKPEQKHLALGEDDEFEDFPVDGTYSPYFSSLPPSYLYSRHPNPLYSHPLLSFLPPSSTANAFRLEEIKRRRKTYIC